MGRLVTIIATGLLVATAFGHHALAQGSGGAAGGAGEQSRGLQDILVSPPSGGFNLIAAPYYSVERYDSYNNDMTVFFDVPGLAFVAPDFSPEVDIHTAGISVGGDYLFGNGVLLGATVDISKVSYSFDDVNLAEARNNILSVDTGAFGGAGFGGAGGIPIDRDATSMGLTGAVGFIDGPLTILGTAQIKHTNYDTKRSEIFFGSNEVDRMSADFSSYTIAGDVTVGYAFELPEVGGIMGIVIQPYGRMRAQRERIENYEENYIATDLFNTTTGAITANLGPVFTGINAKRRFSHETILSFPATLGFNATVPIPLDDDDFNARVTIGSSFTHDFAEQDQKVQSFQFSDVIFLPNLSAEVEKENRDEDKLSVNGGVSLDFGAASLQFSYQHDFGFDERESADILSAYLRIPL